MLSKLNSILGTSKWYKTLGFVLLFVVAYFAIHYYKTWSYPKGVAPLFSGADVQGRTLQLADTKGRPVLLQFWATWCPICQHSHSTVQSLSRDYQVLSIASFSGSRKDVADYVMDKGLQYSVIVDESNDLARLYGIKGFPANFILDKMGNIRFVTVGYTPEWSLRLRMWFADRF